MKNEFDSYIPIAGSVYCLGWGSIHQEGAECEDRHKTLYVRGGESTDEV